MAFTSALTSWALRNSDVLDLQVTRLTWVDQWCPELFDFIVNITVDGEVFEGRGMDGSEEIAFTKAFAEALERSVMRKSKVNSSNGLAVHSSEDAARECAIRELIERDAFFCHWLTKRPFLRLLNPQEISINIGGTSVSTIYEKMSKLGVGLKIAEMNSLKPYSAYICVATAPDIDRPIGVHIGMGCHQDPTEAIRHAVIEWLRTTVAWCNPGYKGKPAITNFEFQASPIKGPQQHELLAFSIESLGKMDHLLAVQPDSIWASQRFSIDQAHIRVKVLEKSGVVADAPIEAVQAISPLLQDAFFGYPTPEKVNIERLRQFSGLDLSFAELMHEPHPLG